MINQQTPICQIAVVLDPSSSTTVFYIEEILAHAGISYDLVRAENLGNQIDLRTLIILIGDLHFDRSDKNKIEEYVKSGGAAIWLDSDPELSEIFGVRITEAIEEGYIIELEESSPITSGLRSSLHIFGGTKFHATAGTPLAKLADIQYQPAGDAIVENRYGKGYTVALAADLIGSIVLIQQGIPVTQDGQPAPDGSAPIDDDILKTEDGFVLNWEWDRTPIIPDTQPVFLEPITDELRELIIKAILRCFEVKSRTTPILWYYPRGLKSIAMMSHDSDHNDQQLARSLLEVTDHLDIKTTWCIIYPGGYTPEFYQTLQDRDYEIALHFDALTKKTYTSWTRDDFNYQHQWLIREADISKLKSNKNHYTRWENRLEFFHWCQAKGIEVDQSKGPSKLGTIGFPFGGSHPWYPIDDNGKRINVLEINMLTQDLVITCPVFYGRGLVDSVSRHYGIAHFLFHPAHIEKPGVRESVIDVVEYAHLQGMEWWTSQKIGDWEQKRRQIRIVHQDKNRFGITSPISIRSATFIFPIADTMNDFSIQIDECLIDWKLISVYGFNFAEIVVDIPANQEIKVNL